MMKDDFEIPIAPDLIADPSAMPIDEAIDLIFAQKGWPLIGGPSGKGWSYISTAQRCARLFQVCFDKGQRNELVRQTNNGIVPLPLQIGSLFHTLTALYYAAEFKGPCLVQPDRKGLCAGSYRGPGRVKFWEALPEAPEELLLALKAMCGVGEECLEEKLRESIIGTTKSRVPNLKVVLEGERLFDAHTSYWGKMEDLEPLAIEWFAEDEKLGYTCRYDAIVKVGEQDPVLPPGVYAFERKSAAWIDEAYLEGWSLDGEILGELHCWANSDCERRFGKLSGVVMDVISKDKIPKYKRLIIPPNVPVIEQQARWIRMNKANIEMWRSLNVYPQSFANCQSKYGRCENWQACVTGAEQ